MGPGEKSGSRVVAAIDFGTYGTGFAWASFSDENNDRSRRRINFFDQWEGQVLGAPKNRTAVRLRKDGSLASWGHRAVWHEPDQEPDSTLYLGFKMALQRNIGSAPPSAAAGLVLAENAANPFTLIVLCLREVYRLTLRQITRGFYVEDDVRWCLTIPAIWDEYTKDLMYRAAVAAGLPDDRDRLVMVREPAAAALYCIAKGEELLATPGTRFMVVDAGGGTIDITSYEVDDDRRLRELARADGAKAGSEFVDRAFMTEILEKRLGSDLVNRMLDTDRNAIYQVMTSWERVKRSFAPAGPDTVIIPLSARLYAELMREWDRNRQAAPKRSSPHGGGRRAGHKRGEGFNQPAPAPELDIVLRRSEVAALFDIVVDQTIAQVEAQLREMRAISGASGGELAVLVGGFAESPYLHQRLGAHLAQEGIRLIVPEQPSIAVLAGAVHFAYDSSVFASWRAPFTCGASISKPFRPGIDPEELQFRNYAGNLMCRNRFDPFVETNQSVRTDAPPLQRQYFPTVADSDVIVIGICTSTDSAVEHTHQAPVKKVAELRIDISKSMHLPVEDRSVIVDVEISETRVQVTATNELTKKPQSATIKWQPTW